MAYVIRLVPEELQVLAVVLKQQSIHCQKVCHVAAELHELDLALDLLLGQLLEGVLEEDELGSLNDQEVGIWSFSVGMDLVDAGVELQH